jgi:hypothetical protein
LGLQDRDIVNERRPSSTLWTLVALDDAGSSGPKGKVPRQLAVGNDKVGSVIRCALERVVAFSNSKRWTGTFGALLNHVGKFMSEQPQALSRSGVVLSPSEDQV